MRRRDHHLNRLDRNFIIGTLKQVAREAGLLYGDEPRDYKGRRVTAEGILGTALSPHCVEVIRATAAYASGPKILDLGIGYGIYDVVLSRFFDFEVCGIEHPNNISAYARFPIKQGISVRACDLHCDPLPLGEKTFDTVIASEVVEHLFISPKALFSKSSLALKRGGRLVVTTPNFLSLRKIFILLKGLNPAAPFPDEEFSAGGVIQDPRVHPREYTPREIRKALVDSGFQIVAIHTMIDRAASGVRFRSRVMKTLMRLLPGHGDRIVAIGEKA